MSKAFFLILGVYSGDPKLGSVALTAVPTSYASEAGCRAAGDVFTMTDFQRFYTCIPRGKSR